MSAPFALSSKSLSTPTQNPTQPSQTSSLFGTNTMRPAPLIGASFGTLSTSPMTQSQGQTFILPAQYPQRLPITPENAVKMAIDAWDPSSPNCQFKTHFYNLVHPSEAKKYVMTTRDDEGLWEQAVKNNPDPTCLVPALAVGFGDLDKRVAKQTEHLENLKYRLGEIAITCDILVQRHQTDTYTLIEEHSRKHRELSARVMLLFQKLHLLRQSGAAMSVEEDRLRGKLEDLVSHLRKPQSQIMNLWRDMSSVPYSQLNDEVLSSEVGADAGQYNKVLAHHFQGIEHLVGILKTDTHDIQHMHQKLQSNA